MYAIAVTISFAKILINELNLTNTHVRIKYFTQVFKTWEKLTLSYIIDR